MHVYRDTTGRSWKTHLDDAEIARVRSVTGIDLGTARAGILPVRPEQVEEIEWILATLAQPQADREGVPAPDLADPETLRQAWNALIRELIDLNDTAEQPKADLLDFDNPLTRTLPTTGIDMHKFTDEKGNDWGLAINVATMKRARTLCGIDLAKLDEGDTPPMARLADDAIFLADVLYALVKPAADVLGLDADAFAELMTGATLKAAGDALWAALKEFYAKLGRTEVLEMIETQQRYVIAFIDHKTEVLKSFDLSATRKEASQETAATADAP